MPAIISDSMIEKVTDDMRRICSRREYCVSDIRKKLMLKLDSAEDVRNVLDTLVREKYVDDYRYASAYARDKSSLSGWGVTKIRYMLSSKCIDSDVITRALEEIDDTRAQARLDRLMECRFRVLKEDPQCRLKMLRYGLGRGYAYDQVMSVVDKLIKKDDEEL